MITFHDGPAHGIALCLKRAPFMLRVTFKYASGSGEKEVWDALDQLTDQAAADEQLFLYIADPKAVGMAFYDGTRNGRRHGWSSLVTSYGYAEVQPPDAIMRDNERWVKWCNQQRKDKSTEAKFAVWLTAQAKS